MPEPRRSDPDGAVESRHPEAADPRRPEAGFWLVIGLVQGSMAASIGGWLLIKGDFRFGVLALVTSALILVGARWKRAKLSVAHD